jgi:hypothetical protein
MNSKIEIDYGRGRKSDWKRRWMRAPCIRGPEKGSKTVVCVRGPVEYGCIACRLRSKVSLRAVNKKEGYFAKSTHIGDILEH